MKELLMRLFNRIQAPASFMYGSLKESLFLTKMGVVIKDLREVKRLNISDQRDNSRRIWDLFSPGISTVCLRNLRILGGVGEVAPYLDLKCFNRQTWRGLR